MKISPPVPHNAAPLPNVTPAQFKTARPLDTAALDEPLRASKRRRVATSANAASSASGATPDAAGSSERAPRLRLPDLPDEIIRSIAGRLEEPVDIAALGATNRAMRDIVRSETASARKLQAPLFLQNFLRIRPLTPALHHALGRHAAWISVAKLTALHTLPRAVSQRSDINARIVELARNRGGLQKRHVTVLYKNLRHDRSSGDSAALLRAFTLHAQHLQPRDFADVLAAICASHDVHRRAHHVSRMASKLEKYDVRSQAKIIDAICLLPNPQSRAAALAALEPKLAALSPRLQARILQRVMDVVTFPFGLRLEVLRSGMHFFRHQTNHERTAMLQAIDELRNESDRGELLRRTAVDFAAFSPTIREAILLRVRNLADPQDASECLAPFIDQLAHCTPTQQQEFIAIAERLRLTHNNPILMTRLARNYPALEDKHKARIFEAARSDADAHFRATMLYELGVQAKHFSTSEVAALLRSVDALHAEQLHGIAMRGFALTVDALSPEHQLQVINFPQRLESKYRRRVVLQALAGRIAQLAPEQRATIVAQAALPGLHERYEPLIEAFIPSLAALAPGDRRRIFTLAENLHPPTRRMKTLAKFLPHAELLGVDDRGRLLASMKLDRHSNIAHEALRAILENLGTLGAPDFNALLGQ